MVKGRNNLLHIILNKIKGKYKFKILLISEKYLAIAE